MTWQVCETLLSNMRVKIGRATAVPITSLSQLAPFLTLQFTTCRLIFANESLADSLARDHLFDQVIASRLLLPTSSDVPCSYLTTPDYLEFLSIRN